MKGSLFSLLQKTKVFGIRTNRATLTQLQFVSRKSRRSQRQGVAIYQQLTKKKVKQNIIINSSQREGVAKNEQVTKTRRSET